MYRLSNNVKVSSSPGNAALIEQGVNEIKVFNVPSLMFALNAVRMDSLEIRLLRLEGRDIEQILNKNYEIGDNITVRMSSKGAIIEQKTRKNKIIKIEITDVIELSIILGWLFRDSLDVRIMDIEDEFFYRHC